MPPVFTGLALFKTVIVGLVSFGSYCIYKKKQKQKIQKQNIEEIEFINCSGGSGKDPNNDEDLLKKHPNGIYENTSYHHINSYGAKGPCPKNGQTCLDFSLPIQGTNAQRIGIEGDTFVIFKKTSTNTYHGYTIT